MSNFELMFLGLVVLCNVVAGVLALVALSWLAQELTIHRKSLKSDFENRVRHDLDMVHHVGEMIMGLSMNDRPRIIEQLRKNNVKQEQRKLVLARHLAKEPRGPRLRGESSRAGAGARVHGI